MIKNKFLHFKTMGGQDPENGTSFLDALDQGLISDEHIAFIQDEPAIWTHGTFYYAGKEPVNADFKHIEDQLEVLSGAHVVDVKVSPAVIYINTPTVVAVTADLETEFVTSDAGLTLQKDTNVFYSGEYIPNAPHTITVNLPHGDQLFIAQITMKDLSFTGHGTLYARNPVYYGFGESVNDITTKASPRTSAAGTYKATASSDGLNFFILVPSDVIDVNRFTMGGAPYVMEDVTQTTIDDVTYNVHKSAAFYNTGAVVDVTAAV